MKSAVQVALNRCWLVKRKLFGKRKWSDGVVSRIPAVLFFVFPFSRLKTISIAVRRSS
jgi:hypothetical protein